MIAESQGSAALNDDTSQEACVAEGEDVKSAKLVGWQAGNRLSQGQLQDFRTRSRPDALKLVNKFTPLIETPLKVCLSSLSSRSHITYPLASFSFASSVIYTAASSAYNNRVTCPRLVLHHTKRALQATWLQRKVCYSHQIHTKLYTTLADDVEASSAATTASSSRPQRAKRPAPEEPASTVAANTAKKRKIAKATPASTDKSTKSSKSAVAKTVSSKSAGKKEPAKKPATNAQNTANTSKKRKSEDDVDERPSKKSSIPKDAAIKTAAVKKAVPDKPAKKARTTKTAANTTKAAPKKEPAVEKTLKKGAVINYAPTQRLDVLVFGEGSAGELGLGTLKTAVDVKRPRLNSNLLADNVGVVQIAAGGMHVVALTANNTILTWGVNDAKALGRDTTWDGGLRDMDAEDNGSDSGSDSDDDSGMNPREASPAEVDWSETTLAKDTTWTQVAAGDSCSFALTNDGLVYGWGTFRSNEGPFGFAPSVDEAARPVLVQDLKNIVSIACGANHVLALDKKGVVFAWGSGQQNQLGRRVVERNKRDSLLPRPLGMPRGAKNKVKAIASGEYHSFAIAQDGDVYAWGLNSFGETGIPTTGDDEAVIMNAQLVHALQGKQVVSISGGSHHSIAATADGDCLVWGRVEGGQCGISKEELNKLGDAVRKGERDQLALLSVPTKPSAVKGHVTQVSAGPEHSFAVTKEGQAYSTGFSGTYQTGLGTDEDVEVFTLIDNGAVRDRTLTAAEAGGQFSILVAAAK